MRLLLSLIAFAILTAPALADDRSMRFTVPDKFLPPLKAIVVVQAGEPGPDAPKHSAVAKMANDTDAIKLPKEGPYDVWWQPKNGKAVRVVGGVKVAANEVKEIKLADYLGIVNVRGDKQPRAGLITIAAQDDPGPDEKGHVSIQTAQEFRVDMVVPDGFYSLWITPESGARSRKIVDRFRVQAGKTVQLD